MTPERATRRRKSCRPSASARTASGWCSRAWTGSDSACSSTNDCAPSCAGGPAGWASRRSGSRARSAPGRCRRGCEPAHPPPTWRAPPGYRSSAWRRYEGPVLAERARVVEEARAARLPSRTDEPRRPLGELVDDRLATSGVAVHEADWDAWRRPDGTWMVHVTFTTGDRERRAVVELGSVGAPHPPARRGRRDARRTGGRAIDHRPLRRRRGAERAGGAGARARARGGARTDRRPRPFPQLRSLPRQVRLQLRGDEIRGRCGLGQPSRKGRPAVPSWDDIVFGTRRG